MIGRFTRLLRIARDVLREEGMTSLLKGGIISATTPIFAYANYDLFLMNVQEEMLLNEADLKPKIDGLKIEIISTNREADELEAKGFEFRSRFTYDNQDLETYRKRLDKGMIACCIFVGYELACVSWLVPTKEAMGGIRQKVDFTRKEAYSFGSWVNPKYRGKGILPYNFIVHKNTLLTEKGFTTIRGAILSGNRSSQRAVRKAGCLVYGKARWIKILRWTFWKETSFDEV